MTEKWQWRTLICWAWPKAIEFDWKKKILLILPQPRKNRIKVDRIMKKKFTMTKIHDWSWPKEKNILYSKFLVIFTRSFSLLCVNILYSQFSVIFTRSFLSLWTFFGQVHQVSFRRSQFSIMFKFFSHIHSIILIRSSE